MAYYYLDLLFIIVVIFYESNSSYFRQIGDIIKKRGHHMKRRDFLIKSTGAGLATGAALSLGGFNRMWARTPAGEEYDLVAVMGGSPDAMFDKAIQAMGGITKYVKKGQSVVVKPNIGWDVIPERGANTHPALVKRIIEHCYQAGASQVYVFDNTCDKWDKCYKNSGIEKAAKDSGAKVVPGNNESYYQEVTIPGGKSLKNAKVHELILESDVFINAPVLKDHSSAKMTAALKNMMGVVWDRRFWHRNDLHQCIADYGLYHKKPVLHIVDAYNVMMRNGPRGVSKADLSNMKSLLVSTDWVTADAAAAKMLGRESGQVDYIPMAHEMGVGNMDLATRNIHRIKM